MKTIDLHAHTTFSDGTFTPTELILEAKKKNISAVAITDHDTVNGLDEGYIAAEKNNIELITGIEFSCFINNMDIHILGYMFDYRSKILKDSLVDIASSRVERNKKMLKKLNDVGIDISYEDLLCETNGNSITRSQFADAILKKGYVSSKNQAFKKYLCEGCKTYVKRDDMPPSDSVSLIEKIGGIPVLAHPLRYNLTFEEIDRLVKKLIPYGLQGIETIYPKLSKKDIEEIENIAKNNNLIITGGSDFHGNAKPNLELGSGYNNDISVHYDLLEKMKLK